MKKIFILSLFSLMVLPLIVQADAGNMMDHGTMWGGGWAMMFFGLIYLAIASFVFSLIFWLVHKWIIKK